MIKYCAAFLLISMSLLQCSSHTPEQEHLITSSRYLNCGLEGFTLANPEHIVNEIKEPFVVSEIKGRIINEAGGGWPRDYPVLFEIRGMKKHVKIYKTHADENGNFVMKNIPEGRYCFKATIGGWQSVMGIIIVNKKADPKSNLVFEMRLGV